MFGRKAHFTASVIFVLVALPSIASAQGFTGGFAPGNWTLNNITADGFFIFNNPSLTLSGGDDGSGDPGSTTFTIAAPSAGSVSFTWLYTSPDDPGFDFGGFVVNGNFTILSSTDGESGSDGFNVASGDIFGFQVDTDDNIFGRGNITIDNFTFTPASVPEPATVALIGLLSVGGVAGWYRRRKLLQKKLDSKMSRVK